MRFMLLLKSFPQTSTFQKKKVEVVVFLLNFAKYSEMQSFQSTKTF